MNQALVSNNEQLAAEGKGGVTNKSGNDEAG